MAIFSSTRERNLWIAAVMSVILIYSTLTITGSLSDRIPRDVVDNIFVIGFFVLAVATVAISVILRPQLSQAALLFGLAGIFVMVASRMGIPGERTHLFEYALVGTLVHQALLERQRNGAAVRSPALSAFLITLCVGWVDELIQAFLPDRVYDWRDVGFNALAGFLAVAFGATIESIRRRRRTTTNPDG